MGDKIAVMNHGIIEQFGKPQEIYNRPASMFVADFIGSPPMNFLSFRSALSSGQTHIEMNGQDLEIPGIREDVEECELVLGVRPEHIRLDDASRLRGRVLDSEYHGTTQIVTIETAHGTVKARIPVLAAEPSNDDQVGLSFSAPRLSVFRKNTGAAIRTDLHEGSADG